MNCRTWNVSYTDAVTAGPAGVGYGKTLEERMRLCDLNMLDKTCSSNTKTWEASWSPDLAHFCKCLDDCEQVNDLDNQRFGFRCVGFLFGSWYVNGHCSMLLPTQLYCTLCTLW